MILQPIVLHRSAHPKPRAGIGSRCSRSMVAQGLVAAKPELPAAAEADRHVDEAWEQSKIELVCQL